MKTTFQGVSYEKMREDFHGMMPFAISKLRREFETVQRNGWPLEVMLDEGKLKKGGGKFLLICYKYLGEGLEIVQGELPLIICEAEEFTTDLYEEEITNLLTFFGIGEFQNLFWASDGENKCKGVIRRFAGNLKRWSWCSSHLLFLGVKKMAFRTDETVLTDVRKWIEDNHPTELDIECERLWGTTLKMLEFYLSKTTGAGEELESLHIVLKMIEKGRLHLQTSEFGTTSLYFHFLFVLHHFLQSLTSYPSTDIIRIDIEERIEYFHNNGILEIWAETYVMDPVSIISPVDLSGYVELDAIIDDVYDGKDSEVWQYFQNEAKALDEEVRPIQFWQMMFASYHLPDPFKRRVRAAFTSSASTNYNDRMMVSVKNCSERLERESLVINHTLKGNIKYCYSRLLKERRKNDLSNQQTSGKPLKRPRVEEETKEEEEED